MQSLSLKHVAWHCGSSLGYKTACRNANSIGIEMCCSGNYLVSSKTQDLTIKLIAYIWKQQGWKVDEIDKRLLRHYDVVKSNKKCPAQFVNNPVEWTNFKNKLRKELGGSMEKKPVKLQQYGAHFTNIDRLAYIPMENPKGETVSAAATSAQWNGRYPDAISNAELFNMSTYKPSSGVVNQGVKEFLTDTLGIGFKDNKKPEISWKNNINAPDWLGGYPMLLRDGELAFTNVPAGLEGKRARTAIAFNDTTFSFFWVTAADGCELKDFALAIKDKGFHTALNLDGGGSTAFVTPGASYEQKRKVRGKIGLWIKGGTGNKLGKNSQIKPANTNTGMLQDKTKAAGTTLTISANGGLNMRSSAPSGSVVEVLPNKSRVNWYGYYTIKNNIKWYYVKAPSGKTGYISSQFVK